MLFTEGMTQRERRPFLEPNEGERPPEKEVSSKAYARLQVAADAIAATKKAIPHAGNQVEGLRATNMNSNFRLQVMRDKRCWDYATVEQWQLAYENPEADIAAKADLAHGGNCGEHAWVAYHYLRLHATGERIQASAKNGLDHMFVLIGDLETEKDDELAVADAWPTNPTACLWEDHFAWTRRADIIDHTHTVADGVSFKAAIAAGLRLTPYGEEMIKKAASPEETAEKTENWLANNYWWDPDSAKEKFEYKAKGDADEGALGVAAEGGEVGSRRHAGT